MLRMTRLEQCMYDRRNRTPLVEALSFREKVQAVRTEGFNRITAMASTNYGGKNYIPLAVLNEMIERTDPQPHHRIAVFDHITRSILDLLGCKDVILFDRGDGFLATSMKFDIIIGNPPYDQSKSKKIWPDFINKSLSLINQGGYVAMVCPSSWLTSNGSAYRKIRTELTTSHDLQMVGRSAGDHFDVGVDICYWVAQASAYQGLTQYEERGVISQIDLRDGIPKAADELFVDGLINRIIAHGPGIPWIINDKGSNLVSNSEIADQQSQSHPYKVYQSTNRVGYISRALPDHGSLKLAVNFSSAFYSARSADHNMPIVSDEIGSLMGYVVISSVDEGLMMRSYLSSKLVRFLVNNYKKKNTGFSDAVKRRAIPQVPNRYWTDAELYAHFGLAPAEIDHIESTIA